jgi:hypothetical protein
VKGSQPAKIAGDRWGARWLYSAAEVAGLLGCTTR